MNHAALKFTAILALRIFFILPAAASACSLAQASIVAPQSTAQNDEIPASLPYSISPERFDLVQCLAVAAPPPRQTHHRLRPMFFQSLNEHPRTARQVAIRDSVFRVADHRGQYVRVQLAGHKVLTGTIYSANRLGFLLQTDIAHSRHIKYAELVEPVQPVAGVGTRVVRGLETTGIVAALIILVPITIPLVLTGVIRD